MKFLIILSIMACALVGATSNLCAQETVWQQMGRAQDTTAQAAVVEAQAAAVQTQVAVAAEQRVQRAEAQAYADRLAQARAEAAQAKTEAAERKRQEEQAARESFDKACVAMHERMARERGQVQTTPAEVTTTQIADSDEVMRTFLEAKGYKNVTDTDIARIRLYMLDHGLTHISEVKFK